MLGEITYEKQSMEQAAAAREQKDNLAQVIVPKPCMTATTSIILLDSKSAQ